MYKRAVQLFKLHCQECGFATGGLEAERHVPLRQWLRFERYFASAQYRRPVEIEIKDSSHLHWLKVVQCTVVCKSCGIPYHSIFICPYAGAAQWQFAALAFQFFAVAVALILLIRPTTPIAISISVVFVCAAILRCYRRRILPNHIPQISRDESGAVCYSCQASSSISLSMAANDQEPLPCPICKRETSHVVPV